MTTIKPSSTPIVERRGETPARKAPPTDSSTRPAKETDLLETNRASPPSPENRNTTSFESGMASPKANRIGSAPAFESVPEIPKDIASPNRLEGLIRGTKHEPVFGKSKHWLGKHAVRLGNNLAKAIHRALDKLVHDEKKVKKDLAEFGPADLDLAIRGKLLRERDLKSDDPRFKAIQSALRKDPDSVPVWIELGVDPKLTASGSPSLTLPSGALLKLGIDMGVEGSIASQRLLTPTTGDDWKSAAKRDAWRLTGHPLSAQALSRVEQGGNFTISGKGTLKVEPSIGLGVNFTDPIAGLQPGASISAGIYATLEGGFEAKVTKTHPTIARLKINSLKSAESGLSLNANLGISTSKEEIEQTFLKAARHFQSGGTVDTLGDALADESEATIAQSFPEYINEVALLAGAGLGAGAVDASIKSYASIAFQFTKGRAVSNKWGTEFEFQFDTKTKVTITDPNMVPPDLSEKEVPFDIASSVLAEFAYNAAIRGDLSIAQRYAKIRGSGVRLCEETKEISHKRTQNLKIDLPFVSMEHSRVVSDTAKERTTSELGRIESQIYAFNEAFTSFFGDTEDVDINVRVHAPDMKSNSTSFLASDDTISADFIIRNDLEVATSIDEFQDQVGLLNALSKGALRDDLERAVTEGSEYDSDQSWLSELVRGNNTFGRTNVNFHVWLGESGLRTLLRDDRSAQDLYREIGQAFIDLSAVKEAKAPRWSRRPELLERLAKGDDISHFDIADEDLEEIEIAREVVAQLKSLQGRLPVDATPAQEKALASELRDIAGGFSDRLKAFTALSILVPETSRAVEMHLTSLRPDETPIRFAYLQDSRSADLLQATSYAQSALRQLNNYGFAVSHETRVRVGAVLNDIHKTLNSPSPDPYKLRLAEHALNRELKVFDQEVEKILPDLMKDTNATRRWLWQFPEASIVAEALPSGEGKALIGLLERVKEELAREPPSYIALKDAVLKLSEKQEQFRAITEATPILRTLARSALDAPGEERESLLEEAEAGVKAWRATFSGDFSKEATSLALNGLTDLNSRLVLKGNKPSVLGATPNPPPPPSTDEANVDLSAKRDAILNSNKPRTTGFGQSYFLRDRTIPAHFFSPNVIHSETGSIAAAQLDMAALEMLSAERRANLAPPALSNDESWRVLGYLAKGDTSNYLKEVEALAYREIPPMTEERYMLSSWLQSLPTDARDAVLEAMSDKERKALQKLIDSPEERSLSKSQSTRSTSDLVYLTRLSSESPDKVQEALSILGYTNTIKHWNKPPKYRLDDILVGVSGEQMRGFLNGMSAQDRTRFLSQIKGSDLSPFTRARLAGDLVSRDVFWKLDEETVESLVSGMSKADYPMFFDQLYADGKLEDFLAPGTFWQRLLNILTFGIARLFTHDNEAALRVLARHGFDDSNLGGHYDTTQSLSARYETLVAKTLSQSMTTPLPIDDWMKSGIVAAHSIMWESNLADFKTLPNRAEKILEKVAEVTAEKVASRTFDIVKRGGGSEAVQADLATYFKALSPESIKKSFANDDTDAESVLLAKAIRDGVLKKLKALDKDSKAPYITPELISFVDQATDHKSFHPGPDEN